MEQMRLLVVGPHKSGTLLKARELAKMWPKPSGPVAEEIATIYEKAGFQTSQYPSGYVEHIPFRAPHYTVSQAGLVGTRDRYHDGSHKLRPGEISLAHGGVLVLDELPEFALGVIQSLRACLQHNYAPFPAVPQFIIGTALTCPCGRNGHRGENVKPCKCDERTVGNYVSRARMYAKLLDMTIIEV